jgi:hypothetical protein
MFGDRGEQFDPAEPEEFYRRMLQDWYYAPRGVPVPGFQGPLATGWMPLLSPLRPFELYGDMAPGGTGVLAWPILGDNTRDASAVPPTLAVNDQVLGDVRAYGSHHTGWSSATGARGFYITDAAGNNQIVSIQRIAKTIKVSNSSSCVAAGGTFTAAGLSVMDDGQDVSNAGQTYPTITNWIYSLPPSSTGIICAWDTTIPGYRVIDAPRCPLVITGTAPSTVSANGTFSATTACGTATVTNWNQTLCSGANYTAILVTDGCGGTYLVIDGDCPTSGC